MSEQQTVIWPGGVVVVVKSKKEENPKTEDK